VIRKIVSTVIIIHPKLAVVSLLLMRIGNMICNVK
jgi:hypothetical protein